MNKIQFYLCLVFVFYSTTGCSSQKMNEKDKACNIIIHEYPKLMKKKGLELTIVGSRIRENIDSITMGFVCEGSFDITSGRKLILDSVAQLENFINSNDCLKNNLKNKRFNIEDYRLIVLFTSSDDDVVLPPSLSILSLIDGEIRYSIYNVDRRCNYVIKTESYYKIVESGEKH